MNTNKYEACMKTFIGDPPTCGYGLWDLALLKAASEIDRVTADLCSDSRRMAERFNNFAAIIEGGFFTDSPTSPQLPPTAGASPTGYSTLGNITSNTARLRELKDQLRVLLRLRYNTDEIAAFYESLSLRSVQSRG